MSLRPEKKIVRTMGICRNFLEKLPLTKGIMVWAAVAVIPMGRAEGTAAANAPAEETAGRFDWLLNISMEEVILYILLGFLVLIMLYFVQVINSLLKVLKGEVDHVIRTQGVMAEEAPKPKRKTVFTQLMQALTRARALEEEKDIMLDHDYDGIKELDNSLPPWWKWMFYLCIVWAFFYLVNYHIVPIWNSGVLQDEEYTAEMEEGKRLLAEYKKKAADFVDENTVTMPEDKAVIAKGKAKFDEVCAACHGTQGQGDVGPNLTDPYWLHGGSIKDIFKTIKYGVPEKGMISWQDQLKASEMQALAGYILTLQGTNPANPKEPQGSLYNPAAADSAQSAAADTTLTPAP